MRAEDLRESRAYEIVIEATGAPKGLETALEKVLPRGTIVLKSTVADRGKVNLSRAVVDEVTLVGSRCGPFAPAVAALASARLNVRPLVSAVYPFDDALSAFERARQKGVLKVLLDFRTHHRTPSLGRGAFRLSLSTVLLIRVSLRFHRPRGRWRESLLC